MIVKIFNGLQKLEAVSYTHLLNELQTVMNKGFGLCGKTIQLQFIHFVSYRASLWVRTYIKKVIYYAKNFVLWEYVNPYSTFYVLYYW